MPEWGETRNEARCAARKPGPGCDGVSLNDQDSSKRQGFIARAVILWKLRQLVG